MTRLDRWNDRYSRGEETYGHKPSAPLPRAVAGVAPGLALDLACGAGRHAIYLAERGWRVVAVDGSSAGVELMLREARRRGVEARIEARVADLETEPRAFGIEPERYDLLCDFHFLDRGLFPALLSGVRPGGLFVAAIHVEDPREAAPHGFLLRPGELRDLVAGPGWEILHVLEGPSAEEGHQHATAELIARKAAGGAGPG